MSQLPAYSSYFLPWDDFASIVNFVSRDTVHTLDRRLITFIIRNRFPSLNEAWSVSLFLSLPLSFFSSLNKFFYNYASYNKKKKNSGKEKLVKSIRLEFSMEIEKLLSIFPLRKRRSSAWTV